MATTRQGGAGMALTRFPLYPQNAFALTNTNSFNTNVNELALGSGETFVLPAGQWQVTPGPYSFVQQKDQITGIWRSISQTPNVSRYVMSDGANFRVANLTGCALGAYITNVGSGYTSAPTVSASAGSSTWVAIVGGAINTTVTITTAGAGYSHKPMLIVEPPQSSQGVQATAVCTVSAGAINAVTVIDQGAGYTTAPRITIVPDPRDTVTTQAVLTTALTGSGTITAILCTDHGTPLTSVPTLTISGGGGASGAATVVMCFTATGFTVDNGGAVYGNAQPFLVTAAGGRVAGAAGAVVNPTVGVGLLNPRTAFITGTSTAGGAVTATGAVIQDGGLFAAVPTGFVTAAGTAALPTTTAIVTVTVGGVSDLSLVQPI